MTDDAPECPDCETDLLVGGTARRDASHKCHGCGRLIGTTATEPLPYDAVDVWFSYQRTESGKLHRTPTCTGSRAKELSHSPAEAREHHKPRCGTCAIVADADPSEVVNAD